MQVNRLSLGLQQELQAASNFNTARNETLFNHQVSTAATSGAAGTAPAQNGGKKETDFSKLDTRDLGISSKDIAGLLDGFSDEVIKVFSSDLLLDNPLREAPSGQENGQNGGSPVFTA